MFRRSFLAAAVLMPATAAIAHPVQAPTGAEAQRMIDEVTAFRAKLAKAVETKDRGGPGNLDSRLSGVSA